MIAAVLLMTLGIAPGEIELPGCGLQVPITRALLSALPDERLTGAGDARSAVLVGDLGGLMHGSVAFLRVAGKWQAFSASPGASSVGVFRARLGGAVFVWTMPDVEGPGQQFDGLSMSGTGGARFCTRVPFPAALNTPQWQSEFLDLVAFNIDATGNAELIGAADVERDVVRKHRRKPKREKLRLVYRYSSRDGGRRWSLAQPAALEPVSGLYDRIEGAPPPELIASLRAQAR